MKHDNYTRKAKVLRIVNGNTIDLEVELGFGVKSEIRVDLARLAAAEQFTDIGERAKHLMHMMFHYVPDVSIQFDHHPGNRSRWIAEVWNDVGQNLSDYLMQEKAGTFDEAMSVRVLA